MKQFTDLFEYNRFCNESYINAFSAAASEIPARSQKLFSHVINAHNIWNHRINGSVAGRGVWDLQKVTEFEKYDSENYQSTLAILDAGVFEKPVTYINSKGMQYTNPVREILFHVINHSTYHRGQVAADLKANGIQPPVTDYIFYKR
jgi:uncharacterized damage-inducible protein DinB